MNQYKKQNSSLLPDTQFPESLERNRALHCLFGSRAPYESRIEQPMEGILSMILNAPHSKSKFDHDEEAFRTVPDRNVADAKTVDALSTYEKMPDKRAVWQGEEEPGNWNLNLSLSLCFLEKCKLDYDFQNGRKVNTKTHPLQ